MIYFAMLALAIGFGTAFAAFGCGIGQGIAVKGALEGTARQPEAGGRILVLMILGLALIESLTIYALLLGFQLRNFLPPTAEVLRILQGMPQ
ncbi:MAG TPA: ATP synthase F0 subunit C [Armatimonadota bacterium]|nr:ATP synthase F0 subunit C [Armatimonadota bacterium]HOS43892.1 ATP synthase F0 subunit C [Armatimonadota bacterium]